MRVIPMQNRTFIPFSFAFETIFLERKSVKTQVSSDLMVMWYWKVICPGKNTCTNWEGGQQPHFTQPALPSVSSKLQIKWSFTRPIEVSNLFLHYFPCWYNPHMQSGEAFMASQAVNPMHSLPTCVALTYTRFSSFFPQSTYIQSCSVNVWTN